MSAAPLSGICVAVTRPAAQAEDLAQPLRAAGANVVLAPLIRIVAPADSGPLRTAIREIGTYDWLVFSSANGVTRFMDALHAELGDAAALQGLAIACVGPATAETARTSGLHVDVVPEEFVGEAIADALAGRTHLHGKRVLLARAGGARAVLPERLRQHGATVSDVEVYRSVGDAAGAATLQQQMAEGVVDTVTLTSASAVRYFSEAVGPSGEAMVAVIGPVTAAAAREHGLDVAVEAYPHTSEGLVAGLISYFARHRGSRRNG